MFSTNSTPLSAVFGTDQLAVHLCPHVRLLFSPPFFSLSLYFEHLLQVHPPLHIREICSLITFNTVFEFSTWNHIRKGEPIWLLPRLFTTSPGEGPHLSNYLFCCDNHLLPRFCLISCLLPVRLTILKIFRSFANLPMKYHIQHHV